MSHRQQNQYTNLSNRPLSPKLTPSSNITPFSQHSLSTNLSHYSHKNHYDSDQISMMHKENSVLREENQALKRQLIFMKKEGMFGNNSSQQPNSKQMNDMRETIKKEAGQIKQLKVRLEVLSKQCKMYEQIIDKMEGKINKLTENNKSLEQKNRHLVQAREKEAKAEKLQNEKLQLLKERVGEIVVKYKELESYVHKHETEENMYKEQWSRQKTYYLNRIKDLQILMGIGSQHSAKDYERKRF